MRPHLRSIILCDIDHVISNAFWRDPMIDNSRTSNDEWDEYHSSSIHDDPDYDMRQIVNTLAVTFTIIGLTSRPEKWRKLTMDWLVTHDIILHDILMRPNDNYENSAILKVKTIQTHPSLVGAKIAAVIEDRDDIVAALRAINMNVIQYHMKRS